MSKELQGLSIGKPGPEADLYTWIPREFHPEERRHITTFIIGLIRTEKAFYPVEMDLAKSRPNNLFIVGDADSEKDRMMKGVMVHAVETISQGYLKINVIADENDPNKLLTNPWIERRMGKPNPTAFPEGPVAGKILDSVSARLDQKIGRFGRKNLNPGILIIDNLGNFLTKTASQPKKVGVLKKILSYAGVIPHLNLVTVNYEDVPTLEKNGIGPDITPGIWLFGKAEKSEDPELMHVFPGIFKAWDKKRKELSTIFIVPFEFQV